MKYARECMVQALIRLLGEKPLSAISITELTAAAGVSRMTYYRNYQSLDDILRSHLTDIFADYRRDVEAWIDKGNYNDYKNMLHCYEYFRMHADFIRCLLQCNMGTLLLESLTQYIIDTYYKEEKGIVFYYTLQAFAGSLYNIYIAWIRSDSRESAQKMASIICGLYPRTPSLP
ncbi:MAG: TetR/AcrR family transcriptional regulator [Lachnospiraceae bacterium]|jgi:AcrR family transcriptional regulator|nr:TetR/AcrR family transcriptional regulator [Lachnospiraceae bacterium]